MTPPTLHELAGIFMLALVTALIIPHTSQGSHVALVQNEYPTGNFLPVPIDGIADVALPGQPPGR